MAKKFFRSKKINNCFFFKWSENIQFFGEKILWSESEKCTNFQRHVSFLFTWLAMWAIFLIKKHFDDYGWKKNLMFIWLAIWANLFKFKNISTIIAEKYNHLVGDVGQFSYSKLSWQLLLKNINTWLAMWSNLLIQKYFDNCCWKIQLIVHLVGDVIQLAY